eukprot:TRINITY_DN2379_c0_g1_i1.p1 TRINITY_DN2379_c0_g1~~TRINITY_DN2379_c0_g1_i1.p1  ORF type:complete len:335 (+),score=94.24 TRINITY_DN2379_c0_g1_i1:157-1161(+)
MGPKEVATVNRDGVPPSDELTWFDRLHTKIESLIDVESGHAPSILLDTGRYLETHVHAVGSNVRKLCADFVRELLMPVPNDPIAEQTSVIVRSSPSDLTTEVNCSWAEDEPTVSPQEQAAITSVKAAPELTSQDSTTSDLPVEDEHRDEIVALRVEALLQQKTPQETSQRGLASPALPPSGKKNNMIVDAISKAVAVPSAMATDNQVASSKITGSASDTANTLGMFPSFKAGKVVPAAEVSIPPAGLSMHDNTENKELPEICKDEGENVNDMVAVLGETENENEGRGLWFDDVASAEYRRKSRIGRSTSASSLNSASGRSDASPGQDFLEWEFL